MSKRIDLTGKTFGLLKVIKFIGAKHTHAYYKCVCSRCGVETEVSASNLVSNNSKGCGSCNKKITTIETENLIKEDMKNGMKNAELGRKYKLTRGVIRRIRKDFLEGK